MDFLGRLHNMLVGSANQQEAQEPEKQEPEKHEPQKQEPAPEKQEPEKQPENQEQEPAQKLDKRKAQAQSQDEPAKRLAHKRLAHKRLAQEQPSEQEQKAPVVNDCRLFVPGNDSQTELHRLRAILAKSENSNKLPSSAAPAPSGLHGERSAEQRQDHTKALLAKMRCVARTLESKLEARRARDLR